MPVYPPETVSVMAVCPTCKEGRPFMVGLDQYTRWVNGELIQDVWPDWSADDREQFKTGICPPCWDNQFGSDE